MLGRMTGHRGSHDLTLDPVMSIGTGSIPVILQIDMLVLAYEPQAGCLALSPCQLAGHQSFILYDEQLKL